MPDQKLLTQPERQRFLEGWLPLAQDANLQFSWALDAPTLEALILQAAPALAQVHSSFEARAILWVTYQLQQREQD